MSNSNRYVKTYINNSALIPQAVPASYPLLVSSNGSQSLTKLLQNYIFADDYYNLYSGSNTYSAIYATLQKMFEQTQTPAQIWGLDIETTYKLVLVADGSMDIEVQWLDADGSVYTELSTTVANIAALIVYLNANISTVTFAAVGGQPLQMSVTPDNGTDNQLVRINITNLELDQYSFIATNVPASVASVFNTILSQVPSALNFYCLVVEGTLFYPTVTDDNSGKITAQLSLANAVEATENQGDYRKVLAIGTSDVNCTSSSATSDIMYKVKAAKLERTIVGYYNGANMVAGEVSARFGLNNGDNDWAYQTVIGIVYQFMTETQINNIYLIDDEGNLSTTCKNGNYYDNSAGRDFFYPGITGSGLPFDITILSDHIARDASYAEIQLFNNSANTGLDVPYSQSGINQVVTTIRGVLDNYLAAKKISPVDAQGNSCVITAPTFAQIEADPILRNQSLNRVLTGIAINFVSVSGINKVVETFYATI